MAEPITIPISIFELLINYERPAISIWSDRRSQIVQDLVEALIPWGLSIDDVEIRQTERLSEQRIDLRLRAKLASFLFGPAAFSFTQESASWATSRETLDIISSALEVVERSGIRLTTKKASISLHLQPRKIRSVDLLIPFVPPQLERLDSRPVETMASVVKWGDRKVTLDGSGVIANAVFLRLDRDFDSQTALEDIARQLRQDEEVLFSVLGVEEDRR